MANVTGHGQRRMMVLTKNVMMRTGVYVAAALVLGMTANANAQVAPAGLYIRGDLGVGFGRNRTFTDASPGSPICDLCGAQLPAVVDSSILVGGGIGYRFNPLFRIDITVDDMPSFHARGTSTQPGNPSGSVEFSSLVAMSNVYVDINGLFPNSFGTFQPYLTAGLGLARNNLGTFSGMFTTGPGAGVKLSETGTATTNFAWGIGAGVGYPITSDLTLDISYKFMGLGELRTGTAVTALGSVTTVTASKSNDFNVNALIVSLRYRF